MKFLLTLSPLYITAVAKKRILEIPLLLNLIFVNNKIPNIIREGFLNGTCQGGHSYQNSSTQSQLSTIITKSVTTTPGDQSFYDLSMTYATHKYFDKKNHYDQGIADITLEGDQYIMLCVTPGVMQKQIGVITSFIFFLF